MFVEQPLALPGSVKKLLRSSRILERLQSGNISAPYTSCNFLNLLSFISCESAALAPPAPLDPPLLHPERSRSSIMRPEPYHHTSTPPILEVSVPTRVLIEGRCNNSPYTITQGTFSNMYLFCTYFRGISSDALFRCDSTLLQFKTLWLAGSLANTF